MALPERVHIRVITPDETSLDTHAAIAVVPGENGRFAIQPGQIPRIAALAPGVVEIAETGTRFFIAGGFVEIEAEQADLLVSGAQDATTLDADDLALQLRNLDEDIADAATDSERRALTGKRRVLKAALEAASGQFVL
ncbi:MAG: hypothetical protein U9N14_04145 [Pseudomonadota bacterium]|nr:hypothetical protein [Pseudomonadota bacterium]